VWAKVRKAVTLERQQLRRLLDEYRPILDACTTSPLDLARLMALAAMVHSFYNGVENIFKRIAAEIDGGPPSGGFWHKTLLDSMAAATSQRGAVISADLHARLKEYLAFRHLFRHSYAFDLDWDSMKPLVLGCEETLRQLNRELDQFLEAVGGGAQ